MIKVNPFDSDGLPVQLSDVAKRLVARQDSKLLLSLILANIAFGGSPDAGGTAFGGATGVSKAVTLSMDTSAYAAGDVLADTQAITGALAVEGAASVLVSLQLTDKDDQTAAGIDLVFLSENVSIGTENSAPSISDANAAKILGIVSIASGDFIDVGGAKVATKVNLGLQLTAPSGTTVYIAAICRGTPTQTASGITINLGIRQD